MRLFVRHSFPLILLAIHRALSASPAKTSCDDHWTSRSASDDFTYANNIWNQGRVGSQCISVLSDDQQFNATWFWRDGQTTVRSYPHVKFEHTGLPTRLSRVSSLAVNGSWSAKVTPERKSSSKSRKLSDVKAKFNVAIDVFLHPADPELAQNETTAAYEIMVWLASNRSPRPLGYSDGVRMVQKTGSHTFSLYAGTNHRGIRTFSWLAEDDVPKFELELLDLAVPLTQQGWGIPYDSYLGLVEFGTETYYAEKNVTFTTTDFSMDMRTTPDTPALDIPTPEIPGAGTCLKLGRARQLDVLAMIGLGYFYLLL